MAREHNTLAVPALDGKCLEILPLCSLLVYSDHTDSVTVINQTQSDIKASSINGLSSPQSQTLIERTSTYFISYLQDTKRDDRNKVKNPKPPRRSWLVLFATQYQVLAI